MWWFVCWLALWLGFGLGFCGGVFVVDVGWLLWVCFVVGLFFLGVVFCCCCLVGFCLFGVSL